MKSSESSKSINRFPPQQSDDSCCISLEKHESEVGKSKRFLKDLGKSAFIYFLCPIIIVSLVTRLLFLIVFIPTPSMEPTVPRGSLCIVNRLAYSGGKTPQYNDIVVFRHPEFDCYLVKRVIATAGQTISFKNGNVFLNANLLNEPFITDQETAPGKKSSYDVPEECIFVMGDNRNNSIDSRFWNDPYVKYSDCIGKIVKLYSIAR